MVRVETVSASHREFLFWDLKKGKVAVHHRGGKREEGGGSKMGTCEQGSDAAQRAKRETKMRAHPQVGGAVDVPGTSLTTLIAPY